MSRILARGRSFSVSSHEQDRMSGQQVHAETKTKTLIGQVAKDGDTLIICLSGAASGKPGKPGPCGAAAVLEMPGKTQTLYERYAALGNATSFVGELVSLELGLDLLSEARARYDGGKDTFAAKFKVHILTDNSTIRGFLDTPFKWESKENSSLVMALKDRLVLIRKQLPIEIRGLDGCAGIESVKRANELAHKARDTRSDGTRPDTENKHSRKRKRPDDDSDVSQPAKKKFHGPKFVRLTADGEQLYLHQDSGLYQPNNKAGFVIRFYSSGMALVSSNATDRKGPENKLASALVGETVYGDQEVYCFKSQIETKGVKRTAVLAYNCMLSVASVGPVELDLFRKYLATADGSSYMWYNLCEDQYSVSLPNRARDIAFLKQIDASEM